MYTINVSFLPQSTFFSFLFLVDGSPNDQLLTFRQQISWLPAPQARFHHVFTILSAPKQCHSINSFYKPMQSICSVSSRTCTLHLHLHSTINIFTYTYSVSSFHPTKFFKATLSVLNKKWHKLMGSLFLFAETWFI